MTSSLQSTFLFGPESSETLAEERASSVEVTPTSDLKRELSNVYGISVGDLLAGKFRVERILGEGGMGLVVAATHLGLDERVALKLLHPNARRNPEAVARFFQEAKAAAKLKSEHVAHVLDVSQREDGAPFIVMEFLRGSDLRYTLDVDGPLPIGTVAHYMIQACEALAEAHARGIVHRDIKPENLFLTERSEGWRIVKILDFGISKASLTGSTLSATNIRTGAIMGSPSYMSPEQLRETATVDHRTDLWALGAVMYELLTGHPAFDCQKSLTALIIDILQNEPVPVTTWRPEVPEELAAIVARCLEKDREDRPASAAELAIALLPFAPRARVAAERALAITKEAGMSHDGVFMPLSAPPRAPSRGAGLENTALALDVSMPPISSRQIITRPEVIEVGAHRSVTRKGRRLAITALVGAALVGAVAMGHWSASAASPRAEAQRTRVAPRHVLAAVEATRAPENRDSPTKTTRRAPAIASPRPEPAAAPPASTTPLLDIQGSR